MNKRMGGLVLGGVFAAVAVIRLLFGNGIFREQDLAMGAFVVIVGLIVLMVGCMVLYWLVEQSRERNRRWTR